MESGKIHLDLAKFRLDELIEVVVDEIRHTSGGQEFEVHTKDIMVTADHDKIGTILTNLLSNAVKYAKGKKVTVSATKSLDSILVSVKDEGKGINESELPKIFERYYRVEGNSAQTIFGFGIGLYLSSEIIQRHGGRMWAESKAGEGATFYFTLPKNDFE